MKILICGYGNIGKHTYNEFNNGKNEICLYDKYQADYSDESILEQSYDATFVCVPTEMNEDGTANVSEVFSIVPKVSKISSVVIIKSAVPVGTCERFNLDNVVISPEFYGTTQHSLESPNFAVIGSNVNMAATMAVQVFQTVKTGSFRFIFVDWKTAELSKYMENCWIATKVTFCNEFATIAESYGISYPQLRECFVADERVSPSHTFVYADKPYYDSHCLNKDIPALIKQCDEVGVETPLMDSVLDIKTKRKEGE